MDSGYYKTTCVDQSPRQAKAGRLEHTIKKVVDTVNTIPTHKMSDLNERDPAGAANEWQNLPGTFVESETCWSDYQVIINNLHRMSKLLKLIPEGETPENRALRLTRRKAYKKALRAHQEHVRLGVEAEIQTAEDAIEDLSTKDGVTQVELQGAWDELAFLRGHIEGIIPTTCPASSSGSDGEAAAPPVARRALRRADKKAIRSHTGITTQTRQWSLVAPKQHWKLSRRSETVSLKSNGMTP
ncbi:hypothetical protein J4E80_008500 [Alternaria sp. BMP 0032]|nr:hypothetical protein J4E80_008500 [Alternaria sp. BMP 0032]